MILFFFAKDAIVNADSLLLGAFGADWFYLSRSSSTFIIIGTVANNSTILPSLSTAITLSILKYT